MCACVRATSGIVGELQRRCRDARSFRPLQLFTRVPHCDGNTLHSGPLPTCKLEKVLFRLSRSNDLSLLLLFVVTETRSEDFTSWTLNRLHWIYSLKALEFTKSSFKRETERKELPRLPVLQGFLTFRSSSTLYGDNGRGQTAGGGGGARMATLRWNVISLTQMARVCAPATARALLGRKPGSVYFSEPLLATLFLPHPFFSSLLFPSLTSGCSTNVFFSFCFL